MNLQEHFPPETQKLITDKIAAINKKLEETTGTKIYNTTVELFVGRLLKDAIKKEAIENCLAEFQADAEQITSLVHRGFIPTAKKKKPTTTTKKPISQTPATPPPHQANPATTPQKTYP
jgi:hypothetical protein